MFAHFNEFVRRRSGPIVACLFGASFARGQDAALVDVTPDAPKPSFRVEQAVREVDNGKTVLTGANDGKTVLSSSETSDVSSVPRRFQYEIRLRIQGVYDDNINLNHTDRMSDFFFAIEPGITIGFGDVVGRARNFIRLDYAPSAYIYLDHSDRNAIQHVIRLDGQYHLPRLTLGFSQDVAILDGTNLSTTTTSGTLINAVNLDVAGRTKVNLYTTRVNASYDLGGKTFLSGGVQYFVADYAALIGSRDISANVFINYNYSPKLTIGIGATGGYNTVDTPNENQTYEQVNVRAAYQVTGKVSLNASAGVEFREFEDSSRGEYVSPVFELGATYMPFDGTTVSLTGTRRTLNSAVSQGQDYAATSIILGARQRFLRRFYFGLTAGYEHSDYFNTVSTVSTSRKDDYFFIEPGIDVGLTSFWTMGVFYLYRQNSSSVDTFSFTDNQFGLRTSFIF